MNADVKTSNWSDPDDAPELGDEFFRKAAYKIGDKQVTKLEFTRAKMGRPKSSDPKIPVSVRYSSLVVEHFRSTGAGWQSRMNEVLEDYVVHAKKKAS